MSRPDIANNVGFKPANLVFQAMLVKLKQKGISVHKPPIQNNDLKKLYDSFDLNVPADLQNKVFIEFMLYYCNRGRKNLWDLQVRFSNSWFWRSKICCVEGSFNEKPLW